MYVKVTLNGSNRKIKLDDKASLEDLRKELVRCFGEGVKLYSVGYIDSESELISVSNEEDWQICVEENISKNKDKAVKTITIQLYENQAAQNSLSHSQSMQQEVIETTPEIQEEPKIEKIIEAPQGERIIEEITPVPTQIEETTTAVPIQEEMMEEKKPQDDIFVEIDVSGDRAHKILETLKAANLLVESQVINHPAQTTEQSIFEDQESVTSTLTHEMKDEIKSMITEQVGEILRSQFQNFAPRTNLFQNASVQTPTPVQIQNSNFTHRGITCDGCKKGISNCARFKSLVKDDFDLCEACEKKGIHPEPMVRFAAPSTTPNWELNRQFREIRHHFTSEQQQQGNQHFRHPRWGNRGCGGFNQQRRDSAPAQGAFPFNLGNLGELANSLPKNLLEGVFKSFNSNIAPQNVPQQTPTPQPTQPTQSPRVSFANPLCHVRPSAPAQPVTPFDSIHKQVSEVIPGITKESVIDIMNTNNFKNAEEIINFLLQ